MTWLNPWGWWGLAAALPIVALYILRIRRRRVETPTTMFWEEVFQQSKPRAWWQQLRHLVSLLLQLAFLLLVVLALADPLTAGQTRDRRLWVLALDRTASMSMPADPQTLDGSTRLDLARDNALQWTRRIRDWDEAMVITFAGEIDVRCGRTRDLGAVRRAIRSIEASDLSGGAESCRAFLDSVRAEGRTLEAVVFTDDPDPRSGDDPVRWVAVGQPVDNVGITALSARPVGESRDRQRIWLQVLNAAAERRQVPVTLSAGGQVFDSAFFDLAPGEQQSLTIEQLLPDGGLIEARLEAGGDDGLAADNQAWLVVPSPEPARIALVSPEPNLFLEQVLAAQPMVNWTRWPPERAQELDPAEVDVAVLYRTTPDGLPPVNSLYLEPDRDSVLWSLQAPMTNSVVTGTAEEDPRLLHVRLDQTLIRRAIPLAPRGGEVLVESFGAALCVAWRHQGRRVAAIGIDLDQSDLPLRTAFPIWMANLIRWLAGTTAEPTLAYTTGQMAEFDVGAVESVTWDGPGRPPTPASIGEGHATVGPFERVGLYRVGGGPAEPMKTVAVNLANAKESNGRSGDPAAIGPPTNAAAGLPAGRPLWIYLVVMAVVLSSAEWWMYHRRVIE